MCKKSDLNVQGPLMGIVHGSLQQKSYLTDQAQCQKRPVGWVLTRTRKAFPAEGAETKHTEWQERVGVQRAICVTGLQAKSWQLYELLFSRDSSGS